MPGQGDKRIRRGLPPDFPRRDLILVLARRLALHPTVERVWLFGSRARGDSFERSDVDLAIEAPDMNRPEWQRLSLDFEDEAPTLLGVDLLRVDEAPAALRQDIYDEGIVIHERTRSEGAEGQSRTRARATG